MYQWDTFSGENCRCGLRPRARAFIAGWSSSGVHANLWSIKAFIDPPHLRVCTCLGVRKQIDRFAAKYSNNAGLLGFEGLVAQMK